MKHTPKASKLRILWVTDPWQTLDHANDTTLRLMDEAEQMGISNDWCDLHAFSAPSSSLSHKLSTYDHIFYRVDPPVDLRYLLPLQVLKLLAHPKTQIHPPLELHAQTNEKTIAYQIDPKLCPKFKISSEKEEILTFIKKHQNAILKPLNGAQSKGVIKVSAHDPKLLQQIQALIGDRKVPILAQEYLPGILKGEKRLWFAGGKLIATALKRPKGRNPIINMDQGSTLELTTLQASEHKIALKIAKFLKQKKILFGAIDLIDHKITDFNYTSPGLLVGIEKLLNRNVAREALINAFNLQSSD
jgi:glutathione synthase